MSQRRPTAAARRPWPTPEQVAKLQQEARRDQDAQLLQKTPLERMEEAYLLSRMVAEFA